MNVISPVGEVHIVTGIDGSGSLVNRVFKVGQLVDGGIVADNHSVKAHIVTQDVLQDPAVGHTIDVLRILRGRGFHGMVAGHDGLTARQTDHGLMGKQDFFHQHLLLGITTATIAKVMF